MSLPSNHDHKNQSNAVQKKKKKEKKKVKEWKTARID